MALALGQCGAAAAAQLLSKSGSNRCLSSKAGEWFSHITGNQGCYGATSICSERPSFGKVQKPVGRTPHEEGLGAAASVCEPPWAPRAGAGPGSPPLAEAAPGSSRDGVRGTLTPAMLLAAPKAWAPAPAELARGGRSPESQGTGDVGGEERRVAGLGVSEEPGARPADGAPHFGFPTSAPRWGPWEAPPRGAHTPHTGSPWTPASGRLPGR